jgi:tetratricopeptide (TPR) repeat protein
MNATQNPTLPRAARLALLAASIVLAIGSIVVAISTRGAQVEPAVLEQAEIAYAKGLERAALDPASARAAFLESASLIASAIERSDSALLRYNRANALLQAGELGEAIAEYRKAGSLAPSGRCPSRSPACLRARARRGAWSTSASVGSRRLPPFGQASSCCSCSAHGLAARRLRCSSSGASCLRP